MSGIIMGNDSSADRRLRCFEMAVDLMGAHRGRDDLVKTLQFAAMIVDFVNEDVLPAPEAETETPAPGTGG